MRSILTAALAVILMAGWAVAGEKASEVTKPVTVVKDVPQEETLVSMKTEVMSKFLDRSVLRNDDPVAKSDVRIDYKNFGLEFRGAMDLTDIHENGGDFTDIDLQFDYTFRVQKAAIQLGVIYYAYPNSDQESTEELFGKVSYDLGHGLTPYAALYWDFDEVDGLYGEVGVDHVLDLSNRIKLGPISSVKVKSHANVGLGSSDFNEYYHGVDDNGALDLKLGVGVEFGIGKMWTLMPNVEYYYMIDNDVDRGTDDDSGWIYGLSLGCKF